jgi:putative acetyltransferase
MITLTRTDSANPDFLELIRLLDADLALRDGAEHAFYLPLNTLAAIKFVVLAYEEGRAVGCGAIKAHAPAVMEIKRIYTRPQARGQGVATQVLAELERWAAEMACKRCVLETGKRQPEAIALYRKNGYQLIPNYGPYAGMANSVCFAKTLRP